MVVGGAPLAESRNMDSSTEAVMTNAHTTSIVRFSVRWGLFERTPVAPLSDRPVRYYSDNEDSN